MSERGSADAATSDPDLVVSLETGLPRALPAGRATAVFCFGHCFHRRQRVERLEIAVDGARHRPSASGMPRRDLFEALHPALRGDQAAAAERDPRSERDPEVRCYRSGFWATIPVGARERPGTIEVRAEVRLADGSEAVATLGTIEVSDPGQPPSYPGSAATDGLIAICMATFDPDAELLHTQIDSLRAQTDTRWLCVISDDCSRPERFAAIEREIECDSRFVLSRAERNVGFYGNFERALSMIPAEAELVALCDQDDRWYPNKLEVLRAALGDAQLVYSDQRLVNADGRVVAETLWEGRRNNHTNLASLLIANTIVGAASLFRREVAELALPFPTGPGWQFHDHWLGLVAMATGSVAYVDRPLYDYVQHAGGVVGQVAVAPDDDRGGGWRRLSLRPWRGLLTRWRAAYFWGFLQLALQAEVLLARCSVKLTPRKRRTLKRFVASARSPISFAWLAARPARELLGRNETLGTEWLLLRGILWRYVIALRTLGRRRPTSSTHDASLPEFDTHVLDQRRLRRWLARRG